jgi:hypothetical protein
MATDGCRLHIYTPEELPLEQGYYEVLKNTKSELRLIPADCDQDYPDIERVTPDDEGLKSFDPKGSMWGDYAQIIRAFDEGSINGDYLADALKDTDLSMFKIKDYLSPLLLKGGNLTAVIMPTRS